METELEKVLMSFYKTDMVAYLSSHPNIFEEAVHLAITDKQPYSWRAAWLLLSVMEENDSRIRNHIGSIIGCIREKRDGHQRELIKILYQMDIDEEFEGILFDHCVSIWEKINKQPSVRYHAFKMIIKISQKYPELSQEIGFLLQDQYLDTLSGGIKHSLRKMINDLENNDISPKEESI